MRLLLLTLSTLVTLLALTTIGPNAGLLLVLLLALPVGVLAYRVVLRLAALEHRSSIRSPQPPRAYTSDTVRLESEEANGRSTW